jgi:uncharacterized protein (UPF0305 family)
MVEVQSVMISKKRLEYFARYLNRKVTSKILSSFHFQIIQTVASARVAGLRG